VEVLLVHGRRGHWWATREFTIARPANVGSPTPGAQRVIESESIYAREGKRKRKLRGQLPRVQPVWGDADAASYCRPRPLTPVGGFSSCRSCGVAGRGLVLRSG